MATNIERRVLEGFPGPERRNLSPEPGEMSMVPASGNSKREDYEAVVRKMITREDELINQRMLWTAAFNGLLFAALGFAWDKPETKFLEIVLSFLGFATSFLNGVALVFTSNAQRRLLFWWYENRPRDYTGPGVMGGAPLDPGRLLSFYFTPWILLAFIFASGWLTILWIVWTRAR
jgi:hypothetical protein